MVGAIMILVSTSKNVTLTAETVAHRHVLAICVGLMDFIARQM
jgi:hypothetical protein